MVERHDNIWRNTIWSRWVTNSVCSFTFDGDLFMNKYSIHYRGDSSSSFGFNEKASRCWEFNT